MLGSFDCALSGPFAKQFLTRLSATRALCVVLNDVISASTVYDSVSYHQSPTLSIGFMSFFENFFGKMETIDQEGRTVWSPWLRPNPPLNDFITKRVIFNVRDIAFYQVWPQPPAVLAENIRIISSDLSLTSFLRFSCDPLFPAIPI